MTGNNYSNALFVHKAHRIVLAMLIRLAAYSRCLTRLRRNILVSVALNCLNEENGLHTAAE